MGNIGSQSGQITPRQNSEDQWTQSFPRTQPARLQHKVLPDRDARQKLRPTGNGEILQSGGTLTGRPLSQIRSSFKSDQSRPYEVQEVQNSKSHLPTQRYSFHKTGHRSSHYLHNKQNAASQKALKEQMKLFGSEPDLRYSNQLVSPEQEMKERRAKKKYKAPLPPLSKLHEKQMTDWEENSNDDFPFRKTRLFKTRAETKKQTSHVNRFEQVDSSEEPDLRQSHLSIPEMKIIETNEFQRELKEATKRLRSTKKETSSGLKLDLMQTSITEEKEKLKTLDPNKDIIKKKFKEIIDLEDNNNSLNSPRGEPSGKESSTPELSPNMGVKDQMNNKPKSFYFGMDDADMPNYRTDIGSLSCANNMPHSSESEISSDTEGEDINDAASTGIDLQLRPILPKKHLEIPRFSPAAAWKLLSSMDISDNTIGTLASDDVPVMIEERIEKHSRPPPPNIQIGQRSNDKSGDSGISGDAGPVGFEENTEAVLREYSNNFERKIGLSWTPQQDLEDDSSMEELNLEIPSQKNRRTQGNRPHVFSLSLPRDNQLAAYMTERSEYQYSGLQKLKRSVSGVLSNLSSKRDLTQYNSNLEEGNNWFFSKSAPNSLNNGLTSLDLHNNQDQDQSIFGPPAAHKSSTSRVMYLPEMGRKSPEPKSRINENKYKLSLCSKSCEELNTGPMEPETLQDPPKTFECEWKPPNKKPKKFTFQSTVRQIERRRMAEKLSKEAEKKEKQRLRELEAMQKVEEEFQKKRAKEKASIRQQLRLYCMDETQWSSLPPNLDTKSEERQEPDGALSSSTSSSPAPQILKTQELFKKVEKVDMKIIAPVTQELSEYRQTQRDYKEYRGNMKYSSDSRYPKQTTVHPKITCNMPKAKGSNLGNGNYRKDFAFGVKSTKSIGSTHSEDSQNNSPKMYHNKYAPITRF